MQSFEFRKYRRNMMLRIIVACLILYINQNCAFDHHDQHKPQNDCKSHKNGNCNDYLDVFKLSAPIIRYYLYYPSENKTKHQNQGGPPLVTGVIPLANKTDLQNDSLDQILVNSLFGRSYYINKKPNASTPYQPASTRKYLITFNSLRGGIPWHYNFNLGRYHHIFNATSQENNTTSKIPAIIQNIQKIAARGRSEKEMSATSLRTTTTTEKTNKMQVSIKPMTVIKQPQQNTSENQTNKIVPKNVLFGKQTTKNWMIGKSSSPKNVMIKNQPHMKLNEAKSASLSKISQQPTWQTGKLITLSKSMLSGKPSYKKWNTEKSVTILKEPVIITAVPKGQGILNSRNAWVRIQSVKTPKDPIIDKQNSKKWVTVVTAKSVIVPKESVISKQDTKKLTKVKSIIIPKSPVIGKEFNQKWATVKSVPVPNGSMIGKQNSNKWATIESIPKGPVMGKEHISKWDIVKAVTDSKDLVIGTQDSKRIKGPVGAKQVIRKWATATLAPKSPERGEKQDIIKLVTVKPVTVSEISPTRTTIGDKWAIAEPISILNQTARKQSVTVETRQLTTERLANKTLEKRRSKHILW